MKTYSVARRVALVVLLVELLAGTVVTTFAFFYERHAHFRSFDTGLRGRADTVMGAVEDADDRDLSVMLDTTDFTMPDHDLYAVREEGGKMLGASPDWTPPAALWSGREGPLFFRIGGREYRGVRLRGVRVVEPMAGNARHPITVLYASPTGKVWGAVAGAVEVFALANGLLILVTALVVPWLIRRSLHPLRELAGEAAGISANAWRFAPSLDLRRVAELRPLVQAMEGVVGRLERSFTQQRQFTGDAAHELKTAVAVVKSSIQLLQMRARTAAEYEEGLSRCHADCLRMEELAQRMLQLARVEEVPAEAEPQRADLSAGVAAVLAELAPLAAMHGVTLLAEGKTRAEVALSEVLLRSLLVNLVMNAVQHSPRDSTVRIGTEMLDRRARIRIEDAGDGIAADALPFVFDRFFRGDVSRSRKTGGTGLGLAICKAIVERAGGEIAMDSVVGRGTVATVWLPAMDRVSPFTILPSSHARARETFLGSAELEAQLRAAVRGKVRFDPASKALYATDASNYRHVPIGLVVPRDEEDVVAAVGVCRSFGAPVLSRGAGTSLAGQGCNAAVVLDFSKYMNGMEAVDPVARTVRVRPGIVLDRVREAAERLALTFAPDPATHNRCTIGGMIGNNSCGVHGLLGGKTVDNVESLDLLLYDGTRLTVGATSEEELEGLIAGGGRVGGLYADLKRLRDVYAAEVRARFPRIPRRVSGFNLDELLPENGFHVARALVGSEGTCAVVLGATLRLVESPQFRTLVGVGFADVYLAADAVPAILAHGPIGLEGFDGLLTDALRRKGKLVEDLALLPEGRGFLLVEFGGATQAEADGRALGWASAGVAGAESRVYTQAEAARVWRVRESALGATAFVPGEDSGWEGWEDAAVDPARLGAYLRALAALMAEFGYRTPMYGHFGQGCVHMRHNFDLETAAGILRFREFIERAAEIALAHGGSLSGEHGDGQARGALLPKMFGPELMEAFRAFKRAWDPDGKLNPGKLLDAHEVHEDLRLGADYKPWQPETRFAFAEDGGSFAKAALRCVGVGACRKVDAGAMCPSFMATGEELHSTRGRAHLLWELMQGEVLPDGWRNEQVKESLDLCLACKACKSECPVSVDMATYKAEFLSHFYEGRRRPLAHHAFGRIDVLARWASLAPGMVNAVNGTPPVAAALGLHPRRSLPKFARAFTSEPRAAQAEDGREVLLWADTFNNYFHPGTMRAADAVLRGAGFRVSLPTAHLCCGRPLYDFGMLETARRYLLRTLDALAPQLAAGTPIVVLEPSCASVFRDELCNLLPGDARAAKLRDRTFLLSEFLVRYAPGYEPPRVAGKMIVHGHCHHHATMGMGDEMTLLRATGAEVELLDSGCCGMAGPFGFEREKYAVSQTLGERVLLPAVRRAGEQGAVIVADGFSCCEQITQNTTARPRHLAEVLAGV